MIHSTAKLSALRGGKMAEGAFKQDQPLQVVPKVHQTLVKRAEQKAPELEWKPPPEGGGSQSLEDRSCR